MLISTRGLVEQQNTYQKISGVDLSHLCVGMVPAFRDLRTNETHLSMTTSGEISPIHLIDCLPIDWIAEWDEEGFACALSPTVIAGFYRCERFFTLYEIENHPLDS